MNELTAYINRKLKMEVAETIELHIRVHSHQKEVTYQFIGTEDGTKDAPLTVPLQYGYDDIDDVHDWYFQDIFGGKYYLHMFEPAETNDTQNESTS